MQRFKRGINSSSSRNGTTQCPPPSTWQKRHPPALCMRHFPLLTENVPGLIMCTEQLLSCAWKQFRKQHWTKERTEAACRLAGLDATFWKVTHEPQQPDGRKTVRLRAEFTTDGLSVSLIETTVVTRTRRQQPDSSRPLLESKMRLPYIDRESLAELDQQGVKMILVLNPGRHHMVDGKFFSMDRLRASIASRVD